MATPVELKDLKPGDTVDECIEFANYKSPRGYGYKWFKGKLRRAHRIAYCDHHNLEFSDIDGLVVRHRCDNPSCVNPHHLDLGTSTDNNHDIIRRGRGNANGVGRLLNDQQAAEIRKSYTGTYGEYSSLAREYGVTPGTILYIVKNRTYVVQDERDISKGPAQ